MDHTNRQLEILKASLKVMEKSGLSGFTMKNVAAQLGISDAALYKHFKDKNEILLGLVHLFRQTTLDNLIKLACNNDLTALNKLELFFLERGEQFQEDKSLTVLLFTNDLFRNNENLEELVTQIQKEHHELLNHLVLEGQEKKQIRSDVPSEHLVLLMTGSFRLIIGEWKDATKAVLLVPKIKAFWKSVNLLIKA